LGFFKIKSESAVAAGVRRIEAVSGKAAEAYINNTFSKLSLVKDLFNNPKELIKQIENSLAETKELKKKIESLEARNLLVQVSELLKTEIPLGSVKFIGENVIVSSPEHLKKLCNFLVADLQDSGFIILTSKIESKPFIAIAIGSVLANQRNFDASAIIKNHIAPLIKGGGGGSKTLATAGGQDASNLNKVIEVVKGLL
jgi:alanyl-tRNA synthetase